MINIRTSDRNGPKNGIVFPKFRFANLYVQFDHRRERPVGNKSQNRGRRVKKQKKMWIRKNQEGLGDMVSSRLPREKHLDYELKIDYEHRIW